MKIKFENKSMDSYYHMMSISFEGTINKIRNENISKLNILVKNEIAAELCIMAVAEHVRKRFNGYVEIYGEEKLSEVDINLVKNTFYHIFINEIKPVWQKELSAL